MLRIKQEIDQKIDAIVRRAKETIKESSRTEVSPWLHTTGWVKHLQGYPPQELMSLARLPVAETENLGLTGDEKVVYTVCENFESMIDFAQASVLRRVNGFTRFEANRKKRHEEPVNPFNARLKPDSMQRYKQVWKQLLCYIIRTTQQAARDHDERSSQDGHDTGNATGGEEDILDRDHEEEIERPDEIERPEEVERPEVG
jgi:hypothetical protein